MQIDAEHFAAWENSLEDKVCALNSCGAPADWLGWAKHSGDACPNIAYVCDQHKVLIVKWWERALPMQPLCVRCVSVVTGTISDVLRWIPV